MFLILCLQIVYEEVNFRGKHEVGYQIGQQVSLEVFFTLNLAFEVIKEQQYVDEQIDLTENSSFDEGQLLVRTLVDKFLVVSLSAQQHHIGLHEVAFEPLNQGSYRVLLVGQLVLDKYDFFVEDLAQHQH